MIWHGCYDESWKGLIVDEAFAHPAKMARGLIVRIFDYLLERGYAHRGDIVADPFGGVGTTGIEGASRGVRVVACELEAKFVALAKANIELHRRAWEQAGDPIPVIVQGDSRRLRNVLGMADCVVSSPPYWDTKVGGNDPEIERARVARKIASGEIDPATAAKYSAHSQDVLGQYGDHPGNLGNRDQETFWTAARDIVAECHAILKPGGVAVWVVKGFIRKGKLVDFPHEWQRLCESVGFVLVEEIHASLVKEQRNADLFGGQQVQRTERKSFFRRLAEKKGSQPIDFETVLVMRKPSGDGGGVACVVSSPPYAESLHLNESQEVQVARLASKGNVSAIAKMSGNSASGNQGYGSTTGNLGSMKPGSVDDVT